MIAEYFPSILSFTDIFEQNEWHNETTYEHIRNVFINLNNFLVANPNINIDHEVLYYMALYHDIGKSSTIKMNSNITSFPGHEIVSSDTLPREELTFVLGEKRFAFLRNIIKKHGDIHKILDNKSDHLELLQKYKNQNKNIFLENLIFTLCDIKDSHLVKTNKEEYSSRINILENCINREIFQ